MAGPGDGPAPPGVGVLYGAAVLAAPVRPPDGEHDPASTYWELEVAAELAETAAGDDGEEDLLPEEEGARWLGHSKDHRDDLPQVVIAMAVTRDGIPVR